MKRISALLGLLVVAVIGTAVVVDPPLSPSAPSPLPSSSSHADVAAPPANTHALEQLESLEVKGRAPKTGYDRRNYGPAWSDDVSVEGGHNGCDTRNDILRRDLTEITIRPGTHDCLVESGTLLDPYTGNTINFVRGPRSGEVHIDHIVALADSWQKGAQSWSDDVRRDFANDPRNLIAVGAAPNQQKGASDAATWLPPNKAHRCDYVTSIVDVKAAYGLWVTAAEKEALHRELMLCP